MMSKKFTGEIKRKNIAGWFNLPQKQVNWSVFCKLPVRHVWESGVAGCNSICTQFAAPSWRYVYSSHIFGVSIDQLVWAKDTSPPLLNFQVKFSKSSTCALKHEKEMFVELKLQARTLKVLVLAYAYLTLHVGYIFCLKFERLISVYMRTEAW